MNKSKQIIAFALLLCISNFLHSAPNELSKETIAETLSVIPTLIEKNHVDKEKAKIISDKFAELVATGKYRSLFNSLELSETVSEDLNKISADGHLYLTSIDSEKKPAQGPENWEEQERRRETELNYGFSALEIMEGGVGYLKIDEWMHPKRAMPTAVAAMKLLENTKSLIIDLRGNGGGYPGVMEYILNHYFEGPPTLLTTTHYSDNSTTPFTQYTSDLVHGELMVGRPLYVLIDKGTASASEYFAYTLQAFDKAIIVGERSAGAANMNSYFDINQQFRLSVSTAKPINEITRSNWEGEGVRPDISVSSESAKSEALSAIIKAGDSK